MNAIRAFAKGLSAACDHAAGWLLAILVVLNGVSVYMRYVAVDSISWSEEAIRYIAIWITFLGSVAASWADEHLDMNLFGEVENATFQAWHKSLLHVLNVVFCVVLTWQGLIYCQLNGAQTAPTTGLPMIWIYSSIAFGGAALTFIHLVKAADSLLSRTRT